MRTAQKSGYGQDEKHGKGITRRVGGTIQTFYNDRTTKIQYPNGVTEITFGERDWRYHDRWVGGEPYAGMTTVGYDGKVVFAATYSGQINFDILEVVKEKENITITKEDLYSCLSSALSSDDGSPLFRGPHTLNYVVNGACANTQRTQPTVLEYYNEWIGDLRDATGNETIFLGKTEIALYSMFYACKMVNMM